MWHSAKKIGSHLFAGIAGFCCMPVVLTYLCARVAYQSVQERDRSRKKMAIMIASLPLVCLLFIPAALVAGMAGGYYVGKLGFYACYKMYSSYQTSTLVPATVAANSSPRDKTSPARLAQQADSPIPSYTPLFQRAESPGFFAQYRPSVANFTSIPDVSVARKPR